MQEDELAENYTDYNNQKSLNFSSINGESAYGAAIGTPKKRLFDLIYNVMKVQREEVAPEVRNRLISSKLLEEYIKQDEFLKVMNQLTTLKNQKPEYLRQFYEQSRLTETSLSETEVLSRSDYENSRLDTRLWNMIEKERKTKRKKEIIAKKKMPWGNERIIKNEQNEEKNKREN